jgi:hypothetical protein
MARARPGKGPCSCQPDGAGSPGEGLSRPGYAKEQGQRQAGSPRRPGAPGSRRGAARRQRCRVRRKDGADRAGRERAGGTLTGLPRGAKPRTAGTAFFRRRARGGGRRSRRRPRACRCGHGRRPVDSQPDRSGGSSGGQVRGDGGGDRHRGGAVLAACRQRRPMHEEQPGEHRPRQQGPDRPGPLRPREPASTRQHPQTARAQEDARLAVTHGSRAYSGRGLLAR